mgnify:CR=1 FL=1
MADKIWTGATSGDYGVSTNWSPSGVPIAADSVYFTADYNVTGKIGTLALGYLQIDPDSFSFSGSDVCFIDVGAAAIDLDVRGTGGGGSTRGLYVKGSAIAVLSLINGNLGLANQYGET